MAQNVDETADPHETACELVERLARLKAHSALPELTNDEIVLGSDTVVSLDTTIFGKPADAVDALRMLQLLSGTTHQVATCVCLARRGSESDGASSISFVETAAVTFYELSEQDCRDYIATGEPFDKAGSYAIQGQGRALVRSIDGDYCTIVGLPLARTLRELNTFIDRSGL